MGLNPALVHMGNAMYVNSYITNLKSAKFDVKVKHYYKQMKKSISA